MQVFLHMNFRENASSTTLVNKGKEQDQSYYAPALPPASSSPLQLAQ
jgi:hypothetical protein